MNDKELKTTHPLLSALRSNDSPELKDIIDSVFLLYPEIDDPKNLEAIRAIFRVGLITGIRYGMTEIKDFMAQFNALFDEHLRQGFVDKFSNDPAGAGRAVAAAMVDDVMIEASAIETEAFVCMLQRENESKEAKEALDSALPDLPPKKEDLN